MYAIFNGDNKHVYSYYKDDIQEYINTTKYKYAKEIISQDGIGNFTINDIKIDNINFSQTEFDAEKLEIENAPKDITKADKLIKSFALVMADLHNLTPQQIKQLITDKYNTLN